MWKKGRDSRKPKRKTGYDAVVPWRRMPNDRNALIESHQIVVVTDWTERSQDIDFRSSRVVVWGRDHDW
jgi:hypothetical protein